MILTEISLNANAKLNLYLDITGTRYDGYHLLETVMQSIDLCDIVTIKLDNADKITVGCSDPHIPENEQNICYKAAMFFFTAAGIPPKANIYIDKRIPCEAGLGGGSADAAAVLKGLNTMFDCPLSPQELATTAAIVGADVPFCLCGGVKICLGIGEEMCDLQPLPERRYLIVKPHFGFDTKSAYKMFDLSPIPRKNALGDFIKSGEDFPKEVYNVFQKLYDDERINSIVRGLLEEGAQGTCLTGSGSAVFGIFPDDFTAEKAARRFPSCFTVVAKAVSGN